MTPPAPTLPLPNSLPSAIDHPIWAKRMEEAKQISFSNPIKSEEMFLKIYIEKRDATSNLNEKALYETFIKGIQGELKKHRG